MALPPYLLKKDNSVLFNGAGEMLVFVPEKMYSLKLAFSAGEYQNVFGLLSYCVTDAKGKKGPLRLMHEPTRFLTKPFSVEKLKGAKLTKNTKEQDFRVFTYKKGDPIIVDVRVPQNIDNVEDFLNLVVITGNMLGTVPYDRMWKYFMKNIDINGASYGVSAQLFGMILSENCRDLENNEKPFRLSKSKDMTAYNLIGIRDVARLASPYSAFISENFGQSVVYSMMNDKKVEIPLEKVMVGD